MRIENSSWCERREREREGEQSPVRGSQRRLLRSENDWSSSQSGNQFRGRTLQKKCKRKREREREQDIFPLGWYFKYLSSSETLLLLNTNPFTWLSYPVLVKTIKITMIKSLITNAGNYRLLQMRLYHKWLHQTSIKILMRAARCSPRSLRLQQDTIHNSRLLIMTRDNDTLRTRLHQTLHQGIYGHFTIPIEIISSYAASCVQARIFRFASIRCMILKTRNPRWCFSLTQIIERR